MSKKNFTKNDLNNLENYTYFMVKPYSSVDWKNNIAQNWVLSCLHKELSDANPENMTFYVKNHKPRFEVVAEGKVQYNKDDITKHYAEHIGKPFYPNLEKMLLENKEFGMIIKCNDPSISAVDYIRKLSGATIKVDRATGEIKQLPDPKSIRFKAGFKIYQILNLAKIGSMDIPENLDKTYTVFDTPTGQNIAYDENKVRVSEVKAYEAKYNAKTDHVDVYKNYYGYEPVKIGELGVAKNLTHTSDSAESAKREASIFLDALERESTKVDPTAGGEGR